MKKENDILHSATTLRKLAEERLKIKHPDDTVRPSSEAEMLKLIQELELHQIELEMQYEALALTGAAVANAAEKYSELYEFAPSGYVTLSTEGDIVELNIFAAQMLGKNRTELINSRLGFFVTDGTKPVYNNFLAKIIDNTVKETCEVSLQTAANLTLFVQITGVFSGHNQQCLLNLVDITDRRLAEIILGENRQELLLANRQLEMAQQIGGTGSWFYDLATGKLNGSAGAKRLFGLSGNQTYFTIESIEACIPERERVHQALVDFIEGKVPYDLEYMIHPADGSKPRIIVSKATLEKDSAGNPTSIIGVIQDITELRMAEAELQKSEALYRSILQASPDNITIADLEGRILMFSPVAMSMFGYENKEQLINHQINEFLLPDEWEKAQTGIMNLLLGILSGPVEYRAIRANGSLFDIEVNGEIIRNFTGEATNMVFIIRDITSRKKAESELKAKTNLLSNLIVNMQEGIVLEDENRKIIIANQQFCDMFSISASPESLSGTDSSSPSGRMLFKNPDEFASKIKLLLAVRIAVFNDPLELKDGRHFERDYIPTYIDDKYSGHLWKYRDVTERFHALEVLKESEVRFSQVVEQSQEVVWELDRKGLYTYVSPIAAKVYGYDPVQMIGKMYFYDMLPENIRTEMKEAAFETFARKESFLNLTLAIVRQDGTKAVILTSGMPMLDEYGELLGYRGMDADITEQKQAETLISDLNTNLEQRIIERTGELAQTNDSLLKEVDERNKAAAALEEAIGRLQKIADCVPGMVYQFRLHPDGSSCFPFSSEGIRDIYQFSPEDVAHDASCVFSRLHPDDFDGVVASIQASAHDLSLWRHEYRVKFEDGSVIWVLGNALPQREADGSILWHGFISNITERKQADDLLAQTRSNYETFFNTIDDFLFVLDEQGNIIHVNGTVDRRLGYSSDEIMKKSVLMVHPAERREEAGRIVGEMLAGTADFCPVPLITKSGNRIPVETRVKLGFWDGNPAIFGVSKDVSAIKLSEEKFSKAFHTNAALMAISVFEDGRFMDVNESFLKTLGFSREEIVGKTSGEFDLFDDPALRPAILEKLKQNIPIREVEIVLKSKSGVSIIGLFSADRIYIGKDLCLLTMIVDITERKRIEDDLKKARIEADLANNAKSEFLSRMSHELRTPMNSILGFAQLMNMGQLTLSQKKGVNHILNSGRHLLDLIDEVLDISRIEAGRVVLTLESLRLDVLIFEMIDIVQQHAQKRHLMLELADSTVNQLFVKADRQRVKQVLLNLLNNAIKYNCEGGSVTIRTGLRAAEAPEISWVRISISDTGLGIKADDIAKLFHPFERIGAERSETEGTGLGLTVVKKLTEAMGGKIGVESVVGQGTTFWIELPQADSEDINPEQTPDVTKQHPLSTGNSGTILYIEDNLPNAELVEGIVAIHRPSIRVITTGYGKHAVKFSLDYLPDLILLDLDLPDMQGIEVLARLKADDTTKSIPVVVISADAIPQQIEKLMMAGASDYLTKPLNVIMFLQMVDEWVGITNAESSPI